MPTRRFEFVADRYEGAAPAIGCDGLVPGAALDLTHWQGNRTPPEFKADTSTEIALNFVAAPESESPAWSGAVVVNNHFDTDGVLACWVLLDPGRSRAHRDLLIAAAEAGDFDEWPADDRGLRLDAAIRALARAAADDAEAYAIVLARLPELLASLDDRADLWGDEWDQLQSARQALEAGALRIGRRDAIVLVQHSPGQAEIPGPLLSRHVSPGVRRVLLAFEHEDGTSSYRYERPRYAWAETVTRPPCPAPDSRALIDALGPEWTVDDLPGMTGVARTRGTLVADPETVLDRLRVLDPTDGTSPAPDTHRFHASR
jgi:hypothetical protein